MSERPKILILDDTLIYPLKLAGILQDIGYDVKICFNGEKAALDKELMRCVDKGGDFRLAGSLLKSRQIIFDDLTIPDIEELERSETFLKEAFRKEIEASGNDLVVISDKGVSTLRMGFFSGNDLAVHAREIGFKGAFLIHTLGREDFVEEADHGFQKIKFEQPDDVALFQKQIETGIEKAKQRNALEVPPRAEGGSWATAVEQRFTDGLRR